jgi:hypothetical protein
LIGLLATACSSTQPHFEPSASVIIRGEVVDATGQPFSSVTVDLWVSSGSCDGETFWVEQMVTTAGGEFTTDRTVEARFAPLCVRALAHPPSGSTWQAKEVVRENIPLRKEIEEVRLSLVLHQPDTGPILP